MIHTITICSDTLILVYIDWIGGYLACRNTMIISPESQDAFWRVLYSPCHNSTEAKMATDLWKFVEAVATESFALPAATVWKWERNGSEITLW